MASSGLGLVKQLCPWVLRGLALAGHEEQCTGITIHNDNNDCHWNIDLLKTVLTVNYAFCHTVITADPIQ